MRIIYSLCCLLVVACSERHQTFTGIDGTFNTTEFVVRAAGTDSLLFTAAPTFHFSPCNTTEAFDIDDPCMVRIDIRAGERIRTCIESGTTRACGTWNLAR